MRKIRLILATAVLSLAGLLFFIITVIAADLDGVIEISVYTDNDNLEKRFNSDGQNNDPVPGMHYVSALKVPTPYSRITGAGATFDGLALALLMRG